MGYEPGDTFSIWVDERRREMINEFDSFYRLALGDDYAIGDQVKESMQLKLALDRALDEHDLDLDERGKRAFLRQAVINAAAEE